MSRQLIISCEHASAAIPEAFQYLFEKHQDLMQTHEAYDIGAHAVTKKLLEHFDVPHCIGQFSRLLIDLNRTLSHPNSFSKITRKLPESIKVSIQQDFYLPYFEHLQDLINTQLAANRKVLHVSIHSFTPVLHQVVRQADIGLLYDPKRLGEKSFVESFKQALASSPYRVRKNYPYRGTANGLPTYFRSQYSHQDYAGIELEINQKLLTSSEKNQVTKLILQAFKSTI